MTDEQLLHHIFGTITKIDSKMDNLLERTVKLEQDTEYSDQTVENFRERISDIEEEIQDFKNKYYYITGGVAVGSVVLGFVANALISYLF